MFCSCASVALHFGTALVSNFMFDGKFTFVLVALGGCSGLVAIARVLPVRIST